MKTNLEIKKNPKFSTVISTSSSSKTLIFHFPLNQHLNPNSLSLSRSLAQWSMRPNQSTEATESRFLGTISTSSIRNLLPRSISKRKSNSSNPKLSKYNAENTPPADPNIGTTDLQVSHSVTKLSPSKLSASGHQITGEAPAPSDPPVKVEFLKSYYFVSTKRYLLRNRYIILKIKNFRMGL